MPVYDYTCTRCGKIHEDLYYATWKQAPPKIRCESCHSHTATKVVGTRNFIHPSLSTMYGRPEPCLGGDYFQDYGHKQAVLKQLGAQESSDRVHGAKLYQDKFRPEPRPNERMVWGDNMDTIA